MVQYKAATGSIIPQHHPKPLPSGTHGDIDTHKPDAQLCCSHAEPELPSQQSWLQACL
jgi:hypothetical protein